MKLFQILGDVVGFACLVGLLYVFLALTSDDLYEAINFETEKYRD